MSTFLYNPAKKTGRKKNQVRDGAIVSLISPVLIMVVLSYCRQAVLRGLTEWDRS